jgi:hypothetical protein
MLEVDEYSPLMIVIEKEDVLNGNIIPYIDTLNHLVSSKENMIKYYESVDISINGYDDTGWELFEIEEVRDFIHKLDEQFPFWLFFLSKKYSGLQMIAYCFLLPSLTDEAKAKYHPEQLMELLTKRWFGAMNQILDYLKFSEEENKRISDSVFRYFFQS